MKIKLQVLEDSELLKIHDLSIKVLENTGMRIVNDDMLMALAKKGAKVDRDTRIVKFNKKIINETIEILKNDVKIGNVPKYLDGVGCEKSDKFEIQAKIGGTCVQFFDWDGKEYRNPTEEDLINSIKLGDFLEDIKTVGSPIVCLVDNKGNEVKSKMQRIKTASILAKYTKKIGPAEVWNTKELEYLIEIGIVIRGSKEEFIKDPFFLTAKEPISPLILADDAASVLLALAKHGLPCNIIPMPTTGVSTPVSLYSNPVIGNAEILGTAAAIKSIYPDAKIIGGIISGAMDMATGSTNYASPEATLQDLIIAEVHERLYGLNFGMGGYLDAKYPGTQNGIEKQFKFFILALTGRYTYPLGLINWGKCFSPVQALIDLEIVKNIHNFLKGVKIYDEDNIIQLIQKIGIGGSFLQDEHTLYNFRQNLYMSEIFDHKLYQGYKQDIKHDIIIKANEKLKNILSRTDFYKIDPDKEKEIDIIVNNAEKNL